MMEDSVSPKLQTVIFSLQKPNALHHFRPAITLARGIPHSPPQQPQAGVDQWRIAPPVGQRAVDESHSFGHDAVRCPYLLHFLWPGAPSSLLLLATWQVKHFPGP